MCFQLFIISCLIVNYIIGDSYLEFSGRHTRKYLSDHAWVYEKRFIFACHLGTDTAYENICFSRVCSNNFLLSHLEQKLLIKLDVRIIRSICVGIETVAFVPEIVAFVPMEQKALTV